MSGNRDRGFKMEEVLGFMGDYLKSFYAHDSSSTNINNGMSK
jgi:hypothetical protein